MFCDKCFYLRHYSLFQIFLQVLKRILGSMVPVRKRNFLTTQIRSNPDLYGEYVNLLRVTQGPETSTSEGCSGLKITAGRSPVKITG